MEGSKKIEDVFFPFVFRSINGSAGVGRVADFRATVSHKILVCCIFVGRAVASVVIFVVGAAGVAVVYFLAGS